jgi:hypothetical protein
MRLAECAFEQLEATVAERVGRSHLGEEALALVLVIFAGVLALLGLACDHGRRAYSLDYADRFVALAAVLVGHPRASR